MRKAITLGLALLALLFVSKPLAAQTTYTTTQMSADTNGKATFTFATNGFETLLILECGVNEGSYSAQLITHFDQYGAQQAAGFDVPCSQRTRTSGYPINYLQNLVNPPPVDGVTQPAFDATVTLNGEPVSNSPNTVTLQINSASWSYHCLWRMGCPASGSASITITGSF